MSRWPFVALDRQVDRQMALETAKEAVEGVGRAVVFLGQDVAVDVEREAASERPRKRAPCEMPGAERGSGPLVPRFSGQDNNNRTWSAQTAVHDTPRVANGVRWKGGETLRQAERTEERGWP